MHLNEGMPFRTQLLTSGRRTMGAKLEPSLFKHINKFHLVLIQYLFTMIRIVYVLTVKSVNLLDKNL